MRKSWRQFAMLGIVFAATFAVGRSAITADGQQDAATVRKELSNVRDASMRISRNWTLEQVLAMNHESILALWKTLPPPTVAEMNGHMMGLVPNAGDKERQAQSLDYMFNENSVRGYWLGKTFHQTGEHRGEGYNIWRFPHGRIVRNLRVATEVGPSLIDGKPSFLIIYGAYNKANTLVDEMRKLDDYLFLGAATTAGADGKRNAPAHFVLTGPTDEWIPFPIPAPSTP